MKNTKNKKPVRRPKKSIRKKVPVGEKKEIAHLKKVQNKLKKVVKNHSHPQMSALDQMAIAKLHPGQFPCPYIAAMETSDLTPAVANIGGTISSFPGQSTLLGGNTYSYTMIAYCPSLSLLRSNGATITGPYGHTSISQGKRLSGLSITGGTVDTNIALEATVFVSNNHTYSFETLHASDPKTFASDGFSWASRFSFNLIGPQANLATVAWKGRIGYRQLFKTPTSSTTAATDVLATFSFAKLISLATEIESSQRAFHIQSSVVNHNIPYQQHDVADNNSDVWTRFKNTYGSADFMGEYIEYIIIQTPFIDINTNSKKNFTIGWELSSNYAWLPQATNVLLNNMMRVGQLKDDDDDTDNLRKIHSAVGHPRMLSDNYPVIINRPRDRLEPLKPNEKKTFMQKALHWIKNTDWETVISNISHIGSSVITGAKALGFLDVNRKLWANKSDLTIDLDNFRGFSRTGDPTVDTRIQSLIDTIKEFRKYVEDLPPCWIVEPEHSNIKNEQFKEKPFLTDHPDKQNMDPRIKTTSISDTKLENLSNPMTYGDVRQISSINKETSYDCANSFRR